MARGYNTPLDRMAGMEDVDTNPLQPQRLMRAIDRAATDDAVLTCDSGTIATRAARHFDIKGERQFYLSGNLDTMAPGLPDAIGANQTTPTGEVVAGPCRFAMLMAELATAARYDLPIKVVICNNAELGQIQWEQMVLGYPEFGVRFEKRNDFVPWAASCGFFAMRVDDEAELDSAVARPLGMMAPPSSTSP